MSETLQYCPSCFSEKHASGRIVQSVSLSIFKRLDFRPMMVEGEGDSLWFTYLLNPSKLATDLASGQASTQELQQLLKDLLTNLLNNQQAGFFTDNPQELWFAKTRERKSLVLRNLSLQVTRKTFLISEKMRKSGGCISFLEISHTGNPSNAPSTSISAYGLRAGKCLAFNGSI